MCKKIMPKPRRGSLLTRVAAEKQDTVRPTWVMGNTMLFGKDYTLTVFNKWYQTKVAKTICDWAQLQIFRAKLRDFSWAATRIGYRYRLKLRAKAVRSLSSRIFFSDYVYSITSLTHFVASKVLEHNNSLCLVTHSHNHWNTNTELEHQRSNTGTTRAKILTTVSSIQCVELHCETVEKSETIGISYKSCATCMA